MKAALILLPLILLTANSHAQPVSSGCEMLAKGKSSPEAIDRFYGEKAVGVIRLGLAGDEAALGELVSSDFSYTIEDADSLFGPRNDSGARAAMKLATYLRPASYRITSPLTLVLQRKDACIWTVTVVFEKARTRDAVTADFTFTDDRLSKVVGRTMVEYRGDLR